jgi:hypothetical protein
MDDAGAARYATWADDALVLLGTMRKRGGAQQVVRRTR